jgi:hypothetical protein
MTGRTFCLAFNGVCLMAQSFILWGQLTRQFYFGVAVAAVCVLVHAVLIVWAWTWPTDETPDWVRQIMDDRDDDD